MVVEVATTSGTLSAGQCPVTISLVVKLVATLKVVVIFSRLWGVKVVLITR